MYSYGSPHTAAQKQDDQHERTFSSYVRIQVVVLKTYLGRWTIGRSGERGSGISVLPARYDDDDDDLSIYFCIYPFQLPNWFYSIRRELVDETPITTCYPSTFYPILGNHQGCVYCKIDVTFVCSLLHCKCLLFILVCYCSVLFVSISSNSC